MMFLGGKKMKQNILLDYQTDIIPIYIVSSRVAMHLKGGRGWTGGDWCSSALDTKVAKRANCVLLETTWMRRMRWVAQTRYLRWTDDLEDGLKVIECLWLRPIPFPRAQNWALLKCYESLTAIFCSFFIILWASFSIFFLCCSMERFSRSTIFCCLFREQTEAHEMTSGSSQWKEVFILWSIS